MADHAIGELPRIALVFGQESAIAHLRGVLAGQVEVVYAAAADEFDVGRLREAQAVAAVVSLDGGDWLEAVAGRLDDAGIAVVYDDPEISCGLDGWERARWSRHLLAKLRGSHDVDPPRPQVPAAEAPVVVTAVAASDGLATTPACADVAMAEQPLSPEEIETMTVDLAAAQPPEAAAPADDKAAVQAPADVMDMDLAIEEAASAARREPGESIGDDGPEQGVAAQALPATVDTDFNAEGSLDVDTEALSAMIDARLAEPQAQGSEDSPEVWRVVGDVAAQPDTAPEAPAPAAPAAATPANAAADDADVLAGLPSLDDWQLVDPDVPAAASGKPQQASELSLPDSFADLELVPMDTIVPLKVNTDPIERWLHESAPAKPRAAADDDSKAKAGGGKA